MQETRLYDPDRDETRSMRTKEDAQDYRYFPDPDLLPLVVSENYCLAPKFATADCRTARGAETLCTHRVMAPSFLIKTVAG